MEDKILLRLQQRLNDVELVQKFRDARGRELLRLHAETCKHCIERAGKSLWCYSDMDLIEMKINLTKNIDKYISRVTLSI